jgi:hypothetical protein
MRRKQAMRGRKLARGESTPSLREKFHVLKGDVSISTLYIPKQNKVKACVKKERA